MHFYFDFIHNELFTPPENWEFLSTEVIENGFSKSRVDALIETDADAMATTRELVGKFGTCSLNIGQIKESCSVNDVDDMKVIPPIHREKIFQAAIQGDWQFE